MTLTSGVTLVGRELATALLSRAVQVLIWAPVDITHFNQEQSWVPSRCWEVHLLLETPGVGVSEGQESSAVMGGSGTATPLCIRVVVACGEGDALSPSQSHGGCLSWSYFGFILMGQE